MAVEVASRYRPTDMDNGVGGDWFDVIPLPGAQVALVVGDVVGHGLQAAATMGGLRTAVHTLADMDLAPDELWRTWTTRSSDWPGGHTDATDQPPVVGATCLYAVYEPVSRTCSMARARHPPPAIIGPQGQVAFPDLPSGAPRYRGGRPFRGRGTRTARGKSPRSAHRRSDRGRSSRHRRGNAPVGQRLGATGLLSRRALHQRDGTTLPNEENDVRRARHVATRQLTEWVLETLGDSTELIIM